MFRDTSPRRTSRCLVAAGAATVGLLAGATSARAAGGPDDLAFLDNETIDEVVATAEGGKPECATVSIFLTMSIAAAFASADVTLDTDTTPPASDALTGTAAAEPYFALAAPVLVPLMARSDAGTDPTAQLLLDAVAPELTAAIAELRELGFTDDDLLAIQASFTDLGAGPDTFNAELSVESSDDSEAPTLSELPAELQAKVDAALTHEFAAITFLDESTDMAESISPENATPWAQTCPDTAALFSFDPE